MVYDVTQFFDLHTILINEVVGSLWLFIIIVLVAILWISIKWQLPFLVAAMLSVIFMLIIVLNYDVEIIKIAVLLIATLFFYGVVKRWLAAHGG